MRGILSVGLFQCATLLQDMPSHLRQSRHGLSALPRAVLRYSEQGAQGKVDQLSMLNVESTRCNVTQSLSELSRREMICYHLLKRPC